MHPPYQFIAAFEAAGWTNARLVSVPDEVPIDHPAHALLACFGGLHILTDTDTGIECGTSDIDFQFVEHRTIVDKWENLLAVRLCGIALASNTYEQIWLASDGRVFASDDVIGGFAFVGASIDKAICNLLSGIRQRPLLPPDQFGTTSYGDAILAGDRRIYDWTQDGR